MVDRYVLTTTDRDHSFDFELRPLRQLDVGSDSAPDVLSGQSSEFAPQKVHERKTEVEESLREHILRHCGCRVGLRLRQQGLGLAEPSSAEETRLHPRALAAASAAGTHHAQ